MKIRTDFVTNSSSSSFIAFSIKSKKVIEALEKIGFQFVLAYEDTITASDTIITPDGEEIVPVEDVIEEQVDVQKFDSDRTVFEWFLDMFNSYDAFFESCMDEEYEEDEEYVIEQIEAIEKSIKECNIAGGATVTDGEGSFCMHVSIKNGQKTTAILTDEEWDYRNGTCLGLALKRPSDFAELADEYGAKKVKKL